MTLPYHFYMPIFREVVFSLGMGPTSAKSITTLLRQSNETKDVSNRDGYTSNAVVLLIGGAQEAINSHPNDYTVFLKRRKGFVRLALATGTPIVPVVTFGEVDLFEQPSNPDGSFMRYFQEFVKKLVGVAPVLFNGRGLFQYSFGLIPKRSPLTTVGKFNCER